MRVTLWRSRQPATPTTTSPPFTTSTQRPHTSAPSSCRAGTTSNPTAQSTLLLCGCRAGSSSSRSAARRPSSRPTARCTSRCAPRSSTRAGASRAWRPRRGSSFSRLCLFWPLTFSATPRYRRRQWTSLWLAGGVLTTAAQRRQLRRQVASDASQPASQPHLVVHQSS